jgi:predicted DsbA family dithiol-disulfide isomerase
MEMMRFAVTYDYLCPFARNAHEHLVTALGDGAPWDVDFLPFSLRQVHLEEGARPVWEDPDRSPDLKAMEAGLVVKEREPERFPDFHLALFAARHDEGLDLREEAVIRDVIRKNRLDPEEIFSSIAEGWPRETFRRAHEMAVSEHRVFGVPTFVAGGEAVFVRIMTRPAGEPGASRETIERVLDLLLDHPELNEFKRTVIPH